jgi:hypothetical protein
MFGKDTPHDIFVNIGTKGSVDLLSDAWTAEARVAPFQFDDSLDELG